LYITGLGEKGKKPECSTFLPEILSVENI